MVVLIILPFTFQTDINVIMLSIGGQGVIYHKHRNYISPVKL